MNRLYLYNIKYFNFIFYFNLLKYFNFIFYFNLFNFNKKKFYVNLNKILLNNNIKIRRNNNIFNYFNLIFFKNSNSSVNDNYIKINFINFKNLTNIIYNFNTNNLNYLVFDNSKYLHNLYVNMFSLKSLIIFRRYFYINPKHFTHKNFIYFYNQFLINNNIYLIIIFNLKNILNFSHILEAFNVSLFTFSEKFIFLKNSYNIFLKLNFNRIYLCILLFNQLWFISINYVTFKNKLNFLKLMSTVSI